MLQFQGLAHRTARKVKIRGMNSFHAQSPDATKHYMRFTQQRWDKLHKVPLPTDLKNVLLSMPSLYS